MQNPSQPDAFCSQLAIQGGVPIVGTAGYKPLQIFFELAGPWENNIAASPDYPQPLEALGFAYLRQTKIALAINAILPEPDSLQKGLRRVICAKQSHYGLQPAKVYEWLVPKEGLSAFFELLLNPDKDGIAELGSSPWRIKSQPSLRQIFVCCHMSRDRCCGTFGLAFYRHLKELANSGEVKIWQCSHLGGHKYAPTLLELPSLRCWGHLDLADAQGLISRKSELLRNGKLEKQYRGFAGLQHPYEQAAEWHLFKHYGWDWLAFEHNSLVSNWIPAQKEGEVRFQFNGREEVVKVRQEGSWASQASCLEPKIKEQPLFSCDLLG